MKPVWEGEQRLCFLPAGWQTRAMNSGEWGSNWAVDCWSDWLYLYQDLSLSICLTETPRQTPTRTPQSISSFSGATGINHSVWRLGKHWRSSGLAVRQRYCTDQLFQRVVVSCPESFTASPQGAFIEMLSFLTCDSQVWDLTAATWRTFLLIPWFLKCYYTIQALRPALL